MLIMVYESTVIHLLLAIKYRKKIHIHFFYNFVALVSILIPISLWFDYCVYVPVHIKSMNTNQVLTRFLVSILTDNITPLTRDGRQQMKS